MIEHMNGFQATRPTRRDPSNATADTNVHRLWNSLPPNVLIRYLLAMDTQVSTDAETVCRALGLREAKRRRTAEVIRSVAMQLFETRGYDQTVIDDIARDAMVSSPTVFRYYESKDKIVLLEVYQDLDWLEQKLMPSNLCTVFQALDELNEVRCAEWTLGSMRDRGLKLLIKSHSLRDALSRLEGRYRLVFIDPLMREFVSQSDGDMKAQITAAMLAGSTSALVELLAEAEQPANIIRNASAFIRKLLKPPRSL